MTKFVRLSLLLLLVIIRSSDGEVVPSGSEVDGGDRPVDDDAPVCDVVYDPCEGSCWKSGKCLSCCQYHGFVHGKCSLKHGDACYCCHNPDQKIRIFQSLPPSP